MVKALGDRHCLMAIASCFSKDMSVLEISRQYDIPIAVCYRKVNMLANAGILKQSGTYLTQEGKRVKQFRTNIHNATVHFSDGRVKITFKFKDLGNVDIEIS